MPIFTAMGDWSQIFHKESFVGHFEYEDWASPSDFCRPSWIKCQSKLKLAYKVG